MKFRILLLLLHYYFIFKIHLWWKMVCWNLLHGIFHPFKSKITHSLAGDKNSFVYLRFLRNWLEVCVRIGQITSLKSKGKSDGGSDVGNSKWMYRYKIFSIRCFFSYFSEFYWQSDRTKEKVHTKIFTLKNSRTNKGTTSQESAMRCDLI